MPQRIVISLLVLLFFSFSYAAEQDFDYTYRLPDDLLPTLYTINLELSPSPDPSDIDAKCQIDFYVQNETNQLIFHANPSFLRIIWIRDLEADEFVNLTRCEQNERTMTYSCELETTLQSGQNYSIEIFYMITKINTSPADPYNIKGLQRVDAKDGTPVLYTFFEMLGARRVFPCLDEPRFKAKFKLSLDLNSFLYKDYDVIALSNAKLQEKTKLNEWIFHETPLMSTYLLTFAVGSFATSCLSDGGPVRSCQHINPNHLLEYSEGLFNVHMVSIEYFKFLEEFLDSDMDARVEFVYSDFVSFAMEHWGMISMSPSLLGAPGSASQVARHEITHYWFGNLVSPYSWPDLWLSESLTVFMTRYVDYKTGKVGNVELARLYFEGLETMDKDGALPSVVNPEWANDFTSEMVTACYSKGPVLIQMLVQIVGEANFQSFLQSYVKRHQFSTATTPSFIDELSRSVPEITDARGEKFVPEDFVMSWVLQEGYPNINVFYANTNSSINIGQYSANGNKYFVPIWSYHENSGETKMWFLTAEENSLSIDFDEFSTTGIPRVSWNKEQFGYYIIHDEGEENNNNNGNNNNNNNNGNGIDSKIEEVMQFGSKVLDKFKSLLG